METPRSSVSENHLNNIRNFLLRGGNPNHQDELLDTFLHISANLSYGVPAVVELALARANINAVNVFGRTPLHNAVKARNCKVVTTLIKLGAHVHIEDCSGNNVLHYAIKACASLDRDGNCDNPHCPHRPPDMSIVGMLLDHVDIDVNSCNSQGFTPLLLAAKDKNLDIVKALLRKSALVNIGNHRRETPLHAALSYPNPNLDIARELLIRGANFTCKDINCHTPLDMVFKMEGDIDSQEFAEELLKLVILLDENREFDTSALRLNENLMYYHAICVEEIQRMQFQFSGEESLYHLVLHRMKGRTLAPLGSEIVYRIFRDLRFRGCGIYFNFILKCISIQAL